MLKPSSPENYAFMLLFGRLGNYRACLNVLSSWLQKRNSKGGPSSERGGDILRDRAELTKKVEGLRV